MISAGCGNQTDNGNASGNGNDTGATVVAQYNTETAPPFYLSVEQYADAGVGLQSVAAGHFEKYWLFVGGRTNGFHGTGGGGSKFPASSSNDSICLFVPEGAGYKVIKAAIPEPYRAQLSATNLAYLQSGQYLLCAGGYGTSCPPGNTADKCYQTYPYLTVLNMPLIINNMLAAKPLDPGFFTRYEDEQFRVTGGELIQIADLFYLVFGQNYPGVYKSGRTGIYTEQVRTFHLSGIESAAPKASAFGAIVDPTNTRGTASEFHRRDLNVVTAIRQDGSVGIDVYGGVFDAHDLPYKHPISIDGAGQKIKIHTDDSLSMGLYECAKVQFYYAGTANQAMITSLLGGIGAYYFDDKGQLVPGNLPFNTAINTVVHSYPGDRITEYIQPYEHRLPAYIGANAIFIPEKGVPVMAQSEEIFDLNALIKNKKAGEKVLLGKMYGGILAAGTQTAEAGGSIANSMVYNVYLNWR